MGTLGKTTADDEADISLAGPDDMVIRFHGGGSEAIPVSGTCYMHRTRR